MFLFFQLLNFVFLVNFFVATIVLENLVDEEFERKQPENI